MAHTLMTALLLGLYSGTRQTVQDTQHNNKDKTMMTHEEKMDMHNTISHINKTIVERVHKKCMETSTVSYSDMKCLIDMLKNVAETEKTLAAIRLMGADPEDEVL